MDSVIHQIVAGLSVGGLYACIALALVMIYKATHIVNFAQGELAMASTFLAWSLVGRGVPYWIAFAITLVASFATGFLIERYLIRRFKTAPVVSTVIVMIGLMIATNGAVGVTFGYDNKVFESPFEKVSWMRGGYVGPHEMGLMLVTLAVLILVFVFFRFTKMGLAMRAAAVNPNSSRLVGINVSAMLGLGWALAATIGATAGVMSAPIASLDPNMMLYLMTYAFAAAVLGGISNPWGAVMGGLILGVAENLVGAYLIGPDLKLPFVLVVIIATVVLRPDGLFGHRVVTRV